MRPFQKKAHVRQQVPATTRVLRERRPDTDEARQYDRAFVPDAVRRFHAASKPLMMIRPEPSMFVPDHRPRVRRVTDAMRRAVLGWTRSAPPGVRTASWDVETFSRQALREDGLLLGFDFLLFRGQGYEKSDDYPAPYDVDGSHGPLSTFPSYAFLLQTELAAHTSPRIDLHVLTQGTRQFSAHPPIFKNPLDPSDKGEPLTTYVHTETNLSDYIAALLASQAFREAAQTPYRAGKRLWRIVVPLLLTGHFQVFGWDHVWGGDGAPVHDRLFVVTTMPPEIFPIDPRASDNLLAELRRQLGDACLPHTELTPYPGAGTVLRALSRSPAFMDMDCFYL